MAPIFPVRGSTTVGSKLLSCPCAVWKGLSVDHRRPRMSVRVLENFQSSWKHRLLMACRGCQVLGYVLNFACRTLPSSNPAKVLPVLGTGWPLACNPEVMLSNWNTPLG